jgi:hypothetical protein
VDYQVIGGAMAATSLIRQLRMRHLHVNISVLLVAAALAGCSDSDQPPTHPVTGKVVFHNGTPVKDATVRFRTTGRVPPFTASGTTDDQGTFRFDAAEGENSALIAPAIPRDTDAMTPAQRDRAMNPIDPKFLDYETSNLKFQVTPDSAKNQFEIKVWPPRP